MLCDKNQKCTLGERLYGGKNREDGRDSRNGSIDLSDQGREQ